MDIYQRQRKSVSVIIRRECVVFIIILSFQLISGGHFKFNDEMFRNDLLNLVNNLTNFRNIEAKFQQLYDDGKMEKEEINGTLLVRNFTQRMEKLFAEKKSALLNIKVKAESEVNRNVSKEPLKKFSYPNMRTIPEDNSSALRINKQFSTHIKVNMSKSFVHVPTNIYMYNKEVLKTVKWTDALDEVFLNNMNVSNNTLLYQYYGDHSGFLRVYPGNKNNHTKDSKMDLYDCRRRPWYVQVTSSPKDLVILIDFSGSMIGSNIGIAKIATGSLIDTLEENDFFNVITVNNEVNPKSKCLLQATKRNKEYMKHLVKDIKDPKNTLDQKKGLEAAFEMLNSGPEFNRTYASCNQVIMFITDGIESDFTEEKKIFDKFNPKQAVRVFSFLVGRKKNPEKQALVSMACENRGYFYKLETLGNVWDTVLEYLHVMSRPLKNEYEEQKAMYTPIYLDSTGLGMIISISMGVFGNDSSFMGVAGTDVTIGSLNDTVPHIDLGIYGHAFVITNNGFIVMHPALKVQTPAVNPIRLPAPPNILLEDIEYSVDEDDIVMLERNMIDHEYNGTSDFPVYWMYDNETKVTVVNATYSHQFINDTEFVAAIVLSDSERYKLHFKETFRDDKLLVNGINSLENLNVSMNSTNVTIDNYTTIQVSPWTYCNIKSSARQHRPLSISTYPTAHEIFEFLKNITSWNALPSNCDRAATRDLLISAAIVSNLTAAAWVPENTKRDEVESVFVATVAGYSKYLTHSDESRPFHRDVLNTAIFQHALANPNTTLIFSAPYAHIHNHEHSNSTNQAKFITAVAPIRVGVDRELIAVSGLTFKAEHMHEIFMNATKRQDSGNQGTLLDTCDNNNTRICALLDQNGFIIASNLGSKYVGRFIGEQSSVLIQLLVKKKLMRNISLDDTQNECPHQPASASSASILLTPAKLLFHGLTTIMKTLSWLVVKGSLFLVSMLSARHVGGMLDLHGDRISCTKVVPFYLFELHEVNKMSDTRLPLPSCNCDTGCDTEALGSCNLHVENLHVAQDTNLIVLQARHEDECILNCRRPLPLKPKDKKMEHGCGTGESMYKYRKRPGTCFNTTINEDTTQCGVANAIKPTFVILITFFTAVFLGLS